MDDLERLKRLLHLKDVERVGYDDRRKESSADHTYGCLVLAEHFLKKVKQPLDELRVLKLILYHDVVEIETGDFFILDHKKRANKAELEEEGAKRLAKQFPDTISAEFMEYFREFEELKTPEAKFAKAIDHLEPMVHWQWKAKEWKSFGFTEEKIRATKTKIMEPFPELLEFFDETLEKLKREGYF